MKRKRCTSLGVVVGLVLTGCGGSSAPDAGPDRAAPTTTVVLPAATAPGTTVADDPTPTTPDTTMPITAAEESTTPTTPVSIASETTPVSTVPTTTADPRPIDPVDQALAQAGELTADSFAAPWTVFAAGGPTPVTDTSCSYRPDGAVTMLTNGASQAGPTMQLGETGAFVYSSSLAFPSESLAMEYVAVRNTDAWATCYTDQLQQVQGDNGYVVSLSTRDNTSLGTGGFESYAEFAVTSGAGSIDRIVLVSVYRIGRVVIAVNEDYAGLSDADQATFFDDSFAALQGAYDRVNALG